MTHQQNTVSFSVFLIFSAACVLYLISNFFPSTNLFSQNYNLTAQMATLNGLKVGSPVRISGVKVGYLAEVALNPQTYRADTLIKIDNSVQIPVDSTLHIYSDGLLGSKFIHIEPGVSGKMLKANDSIVKTSPGVIIEELIAQLILAFSGASQ